MRKDLLCLLTILALTSCSGALKLQKFADSDQPGWSSFRGDYQNTAYVPGGVDLPNTLLWKQKLGRSLKSSPVVVGRVLIIGSLHKRVHFLDALSGKGLGVRKIRSAVSTSACGQGSVIYFGMDGGKETFVALDLANGDVLWKRNLGDLSSSPALCGGRILVGLSSGVLSALDLQTGVEVWQFKTSAPIISTPSCHRSSAPGSEDEIVCFGSTSGHLYALGSDSGKVIWQFQAQAGIYSSPAIKNGKVFFSSVDGYLHSVKLEDGLPEWSFRTGANIYSSPAAAESLVYVGSNDHHMYAVNQKTGSFVWRFKTGGLVRSSPIAVGDKLFFGSYDGNFYVLDRFTGELLWKYQTEGMISASPAYYDGKVYIASEDGHLYCFGA